MSQRTMVSSCPTHLARSGVHLSLSSERQRRRRHDVDVVETETRRRQANPRGVRKRGGERRRSLREWRKRGDCHLLCRSVDEIDVSYSREVYPVLGEEEGGQR